MQIAKFRASAPSNTQRCHLTMTDKGSESFRAVDQEMGQIVRHNKVQGCPSALQNCKNHCKAAISGENEGLLNQPIHDVEDSSEYFTWNTCRISMLPIYYPRDYEQSVQMLPSYSFATLEMA